MNRIKELQETLQNLIINGKYGSSGSTFLTVREFAKRFKCSSRDAMRIYEFLRSEGLLRLLGGRYYISTGFCSSCSAMGRALGRRCRPIYGVLVSNINNPFFSSIIHQLQQIASVRGIQLIISDGGGDLQREQDIMDTFLDLGCSGVFNCASLSFRQQQYFSRYPLPLVNIAEDVRLPNADLVLVDNEAAGTMAANHLIDCQCRSFFYLALDDCVDADPRFDGYYRQLLKKGVTISSQNIGVISNAGGNFDSVGVRNFVNGVLRRAEKDPSLLPIGLFCHHDMLAVEALRVVKSFSSVKAGSLTVPNDVRIMGFDDLPIASSVSPTITTIAYLYSDIAKTALDCMMAYETTPQYQPGIHEVQSSLVVRESTALISSCR